MAPPGMCADWIALDGLALCAADDFTEGRLQLALDAAQYLVHRALGSQWPGVCTDEIRPSGGGCAVQWLAYPNGTARPLPQSSCSCSGVPDLCPCGGGLHGAVLLPNGPVVVTADGKLEGGSILVDGAPVEDYVVVDGRWLVRQQGWPCCQRLDLPSTAASTFEVVYLWGLAPPAAALMATEVLACELAKAWANDPGCRLPRRLTTLVREGVQMTVLDSFDFLRDGGFGLYEVDIVIRTLNPDRLDRAGKFLDTQAFAEGAGAHRVR